MIVRMLRVAQLPRADARKLRRQDKGLRFSFTDVSVLSSLVIFGFRPEEHLHAGLRLKKEGHASRMLYPRALPLGHVGTACSLYQCIECTQNLVVLKHLVLNMQNC